MAQYDTTCKLAFFPHANHFMLRDPNTLVQELVDVSRCLRVESNEQKWVVDADGTVRSIAAGELPISTLGIWGEKPSTGCFRHIDDLSNAVWSVQGVSAGTGPPSPYGGGSSNYIRETGNNGHWFHQDSINTYTQNKEFACQVTVREDSATTTRYVRIGWDFNNKIDLSGALRLNVHDGTTDNHGSEVSRVIVSRLVQNNRVWWHVRLQVNKANTGSAKLKFYCKALNDDGTDPNGAANSENSFCYAAMQVEEAQDGTSMMFNPPTAPVRTVGDRVLLTDEALAAINPVGGAALQGEFIIQVIPQFVGTNGYDAQMSFGLVGSSSNRHDTYWIPTTPERLALFVLVGGAIAVDQYNADCGYFIDEPEHRYALNFGVGDSSMAVNGQMLNVGTSTTYFSSFTVGRLGGAHHTANMNGNCLIEAFMVNEAMADTAKLLADSIVDHSTPILPGTPVADRDSLGLGLDLLL